MVLTWGKEMTARLRTNRSPYPRLPAALWLAALLPLCGCVTPVDTVIFVTKTSIGIDGDTTPPTASIAYDRMEGYIAPRYPNGEVPPVVASLQGDLGIFVPQISQNYATGKAATLLATTTVTPPANCDPRDMTVNTRNASESKKTMFFGTGTTLGLKLGFSAQGGGPESIVFGYKRKEASVIPIGTSTDPTTGLTKDIYPSVIAAINVRVQSATQADSQVSISDFFATGVAAECLATNAKVHANFGKLFDDSTVPATTNPRPAKAAGATPPAVPPVPPAPGSTPNQSILVR
jgi:hypothetical protein